MMLQALRHQIINSLWQAYLQHTPQMEIVLSALRDKQINDYHLDHLAVIDLPGPATGIATMQQLFTLLGFKLRGRGYLPEKQNDFHWLAEKEAESKPAITVLPQIVIADFRLAEMPEAVQQIILKYSSQAKPLPLQEIESLLHSGSTTDLQNIHQLVVNYFAGRDWPLPTMAEFKTVQQFNELLAWVLIFGRRPNHFTLSIHHLTTFTSLEQFHQFIREIPLELNAEGGIIKGNSAVGLQQGSTNGINQTVQLTDGEIELPTGFIEFIWRFQRKQPAIRWDDYFTDFIANHANRVIESLYAE